MPITPADAQGTDDSLHELTPSLMFDYAKIGTDLWAQAAIPNGGSSHTQNGRDISKDILQAS